MKVPLPLVGDGSPDETLHWMRSERINFYPEIGPEDARSKAILRTAAGLTSFATVAGAHRGAHEMGGVLYVVAGETLSSVSAAGVVAALGTVLGGNRCATVDSFIPDTSRALIIGTGERGYVYDTATGFVEITDANFIANARPTTPVHVAGLTVWPTADGILWSDINAPTSYPALNFRTAETVTDGVVGIALVYGDVWILGSRSIEVVRLTGQSGANAFALAQTIDYGVAGAYARSRGDNGFFFMDQHSRVYRANGMTPGRISSHQIEQYFGSLTDRSDVWGFSFVDRGHEFIGFSKPGLGGETHLYDVATRVWSRRKSEGIDRWRANTHAFCYGFNLFGDYSASTVWKLDRGAVVEGSAHLIRELYTGYLHSNSQRFFVNVLDLVAQVGEAEQTGTAPQTAPVIEMRYSDDGGHNWSNFRPRSLGGIGQYFRRARWYGLGSTRQRAYHFRISDPVRADLIDLAMTGETGDEA